jgi:glycosyltransferase involved in cell wall biosynthesis
LDNFINYLNQVPKISVLLPVYNSGTFLAQAIDSVLAQSFSDFELIVINDGSTDESETIISRYADARIVYVKNESNLGLIATLNKGLALCKGKFIARMDADDISLPQRFEKQVEFLEQYPEVAVVATKIVMIDQQGIETGFWDDDFNASNRREIAEMMPKLNCIAHPSIMSRAHILRNIGYNRRFRGSEDWGLWLTLLSQGHVIEKLDETLLKYRVHSEGTVVKSNMDGVSKRIIRFKRRYIFTKFASADFKAADKKVLRYLAIDMLKYYFHPVYTFLVKLVQTNFLVMFRQLKAFRNFFRTEQKETRLIFFFPFCHLGGAEVVHSHIVEAAGNKKPLLFLTDYSATKTLLPAFSKYASVLEIDQLLIWPLLKRWVTEKIYDLCNKREGMILFSSNSRFYYEFLSHIPSHTRAMDLIHAFMHKHEDSPEKWSLPVVESLSARIIINKKTAADYKELYEANHISPTLLDRIIYISNFVQFKEKRVKNFDGIIKLLFVGRGSAEKRVPLLTQIAHELKLRNLPVEFHFVGELKAVIPQKYAEAVMLHGEIIDASALSEIYNQAHVLAMASTREGFPMVIMEAMMHGLVPVTSNVGGISEHVLDKNNGVLINELDTAAFSQKFISEIEKLVGNRMELQRMSENAYEYAVKHFSRKQFMEAYQKLFAR